MPGPSHRLSPRIPLLGALMAGCFVAAHPVPGAAQVTGVDPRIEAILAEIDPDRMRAAIDGLVSFGTRSTLSSTDLPEWGIGAARQWILEEMSSYSDRLQVSFDAYEVGPEDAARIRRTTDLRNVLAILPGRSERRIYVSGHYDSLALGDEDGGVEPPTDDPFDRYAPGANDDGSGTVLTMELARVLAQSGMEFDATLVFMAIAGEEQGLVGAARHAARMREEGVEITAVFNNDIIGNHVGGNGISDSRTVRVFSEGPEDSLSRQLARYIRRTSQPYVPGHQVRLIAREDRFGRGGDHTPFNRQGFAAVRFTESRENYSRQHNVFDTPDGMDFEYLARNARVNAASVASLALAPAAPGVAFNLLRRGDSGYDAQLQWRAVEGAVGYRIFWREAWGQDWEHDLWVGDVTEFSLRDMSIDDFVYGVAAVGPDGHESLVSVYVRPGR
ncbi:MAG: M20/M25/M40 family metallo-hydrolase [Gemmatimonadales bacterium]|nr:MAG: M20/M25/M40 family metallo-hydrolase [Gemmatimonadales bacterium]